MDAMTKNKLYLQFKLMYLTPLQRNIHWNVHLFIILFLQIQAYFHRKLVASMCKHVHMVALNTV